MVYSYQTGSGPECVFLHGWGGHHQLWKSFLTLVSEHLDCRAFDLPGFSRSPQPKQFDLEHLAADCAAASPPKPWLVGWSLGGMVALQWAQRYPIRGLILIASTASFMSRPGWPEGQDEATLDHFEAQFQKDPLRSLLDFQQLLTVGEDKARSLQTEINQLREGAVMTDPKILAAGLKLLRESDLGPSLANIPAEIPKLVIHGDQDQVISFEAGQQLAETLGAQWHPVPGAGHMPFLSQREAVAQAMLEFIDAHS